MGAIDGSRERTGEKHDVIDADAGFASKNNYERLEQEGQEALIPDRRLEVEQRDEGSRGQYDRSKFIYDDRLDCYICPQAQILRKLGEATIGGRRYHRYANASACKRCEFPERCTPGRFRSIHRDQNEQVQKRMRAKLEVEENRLKYNKRAHAAESPYGHAKWNLFLSSLLHILRGIILSAALVLRPKNIF